MVSATRGLDRGRVEPDSVDAAFANDLANFIRVQQEARVDYYSDGLLRWQDIFRPLAEAIGSARPEALVRWFDTNTFFREPELAGGVATIVAPNGLVPDPSTPRPRVTTLPSPYTFSRAARAGRDRNRLMVDLSARVLRPVIDAAVAAGSAVIHLEEPWLVYSGIDADEWAPLEESLELLHRDLDATLVLHTYFGDAAPHLARLRRLPVDAIGIDLLETDIGALGSDWDKGLVAGIINGRSSIVESMDGTVQLARRIADSVRPRNLYLSSNCELEYLPSGVAAQKVQRLGDAARQVKQLVSV